MPSSRTFTPAAARTAMAAPIADWMAVRMAGVDQAIPRRRLILSIIVLLAFVVVGEAGEVHLCPVEGGAEELGHFEPPEVVGVHLDGVGFVVVEDDEDAAGGGVTHRRRPGS